VKALVALMLLLTACSSRDTSRELGGGWFLRDVPANAERQTPEHVDLLRAHSDTKTVISSGIGAYRLYARDCVAYEFPMRAEGKSVWMVCGDHTPVQVANLSERGVVFDEDGIRAKPGVQLWGIRGTDLPDTATTLVPFIAMEDMRMPALREPMFRYTGARQMQSANRSMIFGLVLVALIALFGVRYARRYR
jgi:hypothetical protein